jgi:hypothetical protein
MRHGIHLHWSERRPCRRESVLDGSLGFPEILVNQSSSNLPFPGEEIVTLLGELGVDPSADRVTQLLSILDVDALATRDRRALRDAVASANRTLDEANVSPAGAELAGTAGMLGASRDKDAQLQLAALLQLRGSGGKPIFTAELSGYAAQAAAKELVASWHDALSEASPDDLIGDLDDAIKLLIEFREHAATILPAANVHETMAETGRVTHEAGCRSADVEGARQFFSELLESLETLSGVAEAHGARTLADLMFLQGAILNGTFIDAYPEESRVIDIVKALPSGDRWLTYVVVEYMASDHVVAEPGM